MRTNITVISALCGLFIFVGWTGVVGAETPTPVDLPAYLELVAQNNLELQLVGLELDAAKLSYRRAQATNLATGSKQSTQKATSDYAQAQSNLEQERGAIFQQAVSAYFQLILAKMDLQIREGRYNLVAERREITERKVAQGVASDLELLQATATMEQSKLDYQRAQQTYQERLLAFNLQAGSADANLYIPANPPIYPIVKYDENTAVQQALAHSQQLKRLGELADLARLDLAKAEAEGVAPLDLMQAENSLESACLQVRLQEQKLKSQVLMDLHTLRALEKEIALSQLNVEIEANKYQTAEKQYQAGLLTDRELEEAMANLWDAQKRELTAHQNYALQLLRFKELVGEELE